MLRTLVIVSALALSTAAGAQDAGQVVVTAPPATTINLGAELGPWLQIVLGTAVPLLLAVAGWATAVFNRKAGIENNASLMEMERKAMEVLQSALTNGAGRVIMLAGDKLSTIDLDVKNAYVREAILAVNKAAQAAVQKFGLTDDALAKMIIDKVGVLTASNPGVAPTTPPNSGAPVS